jgi:hypothetical protein
MSITGNQDLAFLQHTYKTRPNTWLGHITIKDLTIIPMVRDGQTGASLPFPSRREGVAYIVPASVAGYLVGSGRSDVYCPGPILRNKDNGEILGCVGLARHEGISR